MRVARKGNTGCRNHFLLKNGWEVVVPGALAVARFDHNFINLEGPLDVESAYRMHCGEDQFYYLGKVVRWYYGKGESGALHYYKMNEGGSRSKVPKSDGAMPLMNMPDELPTDIDYGWYIRETNSMLEELGVR